MAYVITQPCCNDASCVAVCPVNCIHPTPGEAQFQKTTTLYIEPDVCIDCGACVEACPVDAIRADHELSEAEQPYLEINRAYFDLFPMDPADPPPKSRSPRHAQPLDDLRVAVVGSGPAGFYAASELLARKGVSVDVFERLPSLYGLVRAGVAPDHVRTKTVTGLFEPLVGKANLGVHLGVSVGEHVSNDELLRNYHAVIYAVGAFNSKPLGIAGEDLRGYLGASEFVGWYNSNPGHADVDVDLTCERAVVIGNGNVALDIARMFGQSPDELARTDIADHAINALRTSSVRELHVIGRRGPAQAAFTTPELLALSQLSDCDVIIRGVPTGFEESFNDETDPALVAKCRMIANLAKRPTTGSSRRIILDFCKSPVEMLGEDRVTSIRLVRNELVYGEDGTVKISPSDEVETLEAGMVIAATGFYGTAVPGVPFDHHTARIPNSAGRILAEEGGGPQAGMYTTGWIKRGPTGVIGTNKHCAQETVDALLDDYRNDRLSEPVEDRAELHEALRERSEHYFGARGWKSIDLAERKAGRASSRPRVKFLDIETMVDLATQEQEN